MIRGFCFIVLLSNTYCGAALRDQPAARDPAQQSGPQAPLPTLVVADVRYSDAVIAPPVAAPISETPSDKQVATKYTCPMHPEIIRDEPGRCPKCNMKLVPKTDGEEKKGTHGQHGGHAQ